MKKKLLVACMVSAMLILGGVGTALAGSGSFMNCWSESYFQDHPMSVQQLTEKYGQPAKIIDMKDGQQDYVYKKFENNPMLPSTRHFIIKDGKVIKSFLND